MFHLDKLKFGGDPFFDRLIAQAGIHQGKGDVLPYRKRIEEGAGLKDELNFLSNRGKLRLGHAAQVFAIHDDASGIRFEKPDNMCQQNALAHAAWTQNRERGSRLDAERHAVEDNMILEGFLNAGELDVVRHIESGAWKTRPPARQTIEDSRLRGVNDSVDDRRKVKSGPSPHATSPGH